MFSSAPHLRKTTRIVEVIDDIRSSVEACLAWRKDNLCARQVEGGGDDSCGQASEGCRGDERIDCSV